MSKELQSKYVKGFVKLAVPYFGATFNNEISGNLKHHKIEVENETISTEAVQAQLLKVQQELESHEGEYVSNQLTENLDILSLFDKIVKIVDFYNQDLQKQAYIDPTEPDSSPMTKFHTDQKNLETLLSAIKKTLKESKSTSKGNINCKSTLYHVTSNSEKTSSGNINVTELVK